MKLLFASHLLPNAREPHKAVYNSQLVAALAGQAEVRVLAPMLSFAGGPAKSVPEFKEFDGMRVEHPRVYYTPGMLIHKHWLMYRWSVAGSFRRVVGEFRPDHVLISFVYPDGAALEGLCREAGIGYSIMALGSDFLIRSKQARFRKTALGVLDRAPLVFCPGNALKKAMTDEGIDGGKITAFDNGVDSKLFRYRDREVALRELDERETGEIARGLTRVAGRKLALFVGNLVEVKGPDILLEAWASVVRGENVSHGEHGGSNIEHRTSNIEHRTVDREQRTENSEQRTANSGHRTLNIEHRTSNSEHRSERRRPNTGEAALLVIGEGPMRGRLERRARRLGIADSVVFLGSRPHGEVALWMNIADCLCLPSRSEGMPNVLIEALCSGLPVVASDVGSCGETAGGEPLVELVPSGNPRALADALESRLNGECNREEMAGRHAERFSWKRAAERMLAAMSDLPETR